MKKRLYRCFVCLMLFAFLLSTLVSCSCGDYVGGYILGGQPYFSNGYKYESMFIGSKFFDEQMQSIDEKELKVGHMSGLRSSVQIFTAEGDPDQTIAWSFLNGRQWTFIRKDLLFDGCRSYDCWMLSKVTLRYYSDFYFKKNEYYESEPLSINAEQAFTLWEFVESDNVYNPNKAEDASPYQGPTVYLYPQALPQYCFRFSNQHIIRDEEGALYMCPEMAIMVDGFVQPSPYYKIKDEYLDFFLHPVFPDMPEDVYAELFPEQSTEPTEDPATDPVSEPVTDPAS